MRNLWRRLDRTVSILLILAGLIALWEIGCRIFHPPTWFLPSPSAIGVEILRSPSYLLQQTGFTLLTTMAGFGLALAIGLALAVAITYSTFLERTLYTMLVTLNSLPKVALAPVFVVWMGTGAEPKIAIALTIAIFAIVIDAVLGLRSSDPDLLNLARTARASHLQILLKIRLPSALPSIFAGMKVAISLSLVGAIVGEFVAGETGLGHVILLAQGMFQTPRMFAAIVILGVLGTLLFYVVDLVERICVPWHVSQRGGHASAPSR
ncbi:MAG TPA: ABC transporter permease [Alphaproteobacteria bacterium]|nr:ABC transporter permease [Alphaproteobacteria bacterium]